MKLIKCDKCEMYKDKEFLYTIQMPLIYGAPADKLKICHRCFQRMWWSFPSGEKGVNYDEGILNRTEE